MKGGGNKYLKRKVEIMNQKIQNLGVSRKQGRMRRTGQKANKERQNTKMRGLEVSRLNAARQGTHATMYEMDRGRIL